MNELKMTTYRMPAADLGEDNPLAPLCSLKKANVTMSFNDSVPEKDRKYMGYGLGSGILPYQLQDNYDRRLRPRDFRAIVLENDILRD